MIEIYAIGVLINKKFKTYIKVDVGKR